MRVQVKKVGQLTIAAMAQFERFQSGIQAALLFVQQTIEQEDSGFQFVRRNLQPGGIHHGGDGLDAAASQELSAAADRIAGAVEIQAGNELAGDPALRDQVMERVLHFDMQALGQFFGEIALRGMIHPGLGGGEQRAVTREPDRLMRPQSIGVEAGDLTEGVVSSAMGIAGEIVEWLEFSEDGQVDRGAKGTFEFIEGGDLGLPQVLTQDIGVKEGRSHNVIVPTKALPYRHYNKTSSVMSTTAEDAQATSLLIKKQPSCTKQPFVNRFLMIKERML